MIALWCVTERVRLLGCYTTMITFEPFQKAKSSLHFIKGPRHLYRSPAEPNIRPNVQSKMVNGPQGFNLCLLCNYYKSANECHILFELLECASDCDGAFSALRPLKRTHRNAHAGRNQFLKNSHFSRQSWKTL